MLCRSLSSIMPQANNTVIVGLPVMEATFPDVGGRLSLLSGETPSACVR